VKKLIVLGTGAVGTAAVSMAFFGTGVAAADDYAGQTYADASSAASDAGQTVVIASGATVVDVPQRLAPDVPVGITTLTTAGYRNPAALPDGGVLVVGASASGIQIAHELRRSGRPVTLAVGEHVRMPRTYRGRDILWWMDVSGILDERYDEVPDLLRARNLPSMQLIGTPERTTLDLNTLRTLGVRLVGRLAGIRDGTALFSGSLPNVCALADLKLGRLLDTIDRWAALAGIGDEQRPRRFAATEVPAPVPLSVDLRAGEIASIVGEGGLLADPGDEAGFGTALRRAVTDATLRQTLLQRALEAAGRLPTCDETADAMAMVLTGVGADG